MRLLGISLAFISFMALMPILVFAQERSAMLALRETETTAGRVDAVEQGRACQEGSTEIFYSFTSNTGVSFRGQESACLGSTYAGVRPGDSIPIVYVKADPAINAIAGSLNTSPAFFLPVLLFPLFALFFFAPLFWPRFAQLRKDRRLFQSGSLATGRILFVSTQNETAWPGWPSPTRAEVFVAARLRSGEEREVRAVCTNDWLLMHLHPGTEVNLCIKGSNAVLLENYAR
jgi:hypothetical protein